MAYRARRRSLIGWLAPLALLAGAYACGSADEGATGGTAGRSGCSSDSQCASGVCTNGTCGIKVGDACTSNAECASGVCDNGTCTSVGSGGTSSGGTSSGGTSSGGTSSGGSAGNDGGPAGSPCTLDAQCASGVCLNNVCSGTSTGGTGPGTGGTGGGGGGIAGTTGAHFSGSGTGYRALTPGCGPDTADQCTGTCEQSGGVDSTVIRPPATLCFSGTGDPTPEDPAMVIEQVVEVIDGVEYVHIRITFDPAFTDNTYGGGSCCGWPVRRPHTFNSDLTKSDHSELLLTDTSGNTVMNFKIDYISADPSSPCGYGTLGVTGGDGSVISGDPNAIVAVTTSLDRNLNGCGYCTSAACAPSGDCTIDSPTTDPSYTPNPLTPNWDYRNVYEVWLLGSAFGDAGFGQAYVTYVHASPSKTGSDTIEVQPSSCPPDWDEPYCPPGAACYGGTDGGAGTGGTGGDAGTLCQVNYQTYITSEGATLCTPIPFANYPNHAACPDGYVLDIASEGQYCLPASGT